jgi:hypothetical protein
MEHQKTRQKNKSRRLWKDGGNGEGEKVENASKYAL